MTPPAGAEVTVVELTTGSSRAVLRSGAGTGYTVERTVIYDGPEPPQSHRLEGTRLVLDGCDELPECYFEYVVTVPAGVGVLGRSGSGSIVVAGAGHVDVDTGSGAVEVSDIAGPVRVDSGSGAVRITDVQGDITVDTGSGGVTGSALGGTAAVVETGSGPIDLTFSTVQTIVARSGSGPISLAVAPGAYRLATSAVSDDAEDVEIDVPDDPTASAVIAVGTDGGPIRVTTAAR
ncbi:DUF4097 family beta strand repeat-containing protein [Pseudonocardia nigra]|uniref:DUF4097 family beta strand repeat-containing protein n=1 Tax=Pseudonocardia nigra TaxID=1921578 RepID=UPI001C5F332B|nr:DUF4097 family beta strand repeat-containing protein [Pseudonocardia nigra]